jgi:type II secretory pathway component GspD/PulD (secretin)
VGLAYFYRNEYREAKRNFRMAAQLDPNFTEALRLLHRTEFILEERHSAFETVKEDLVQRKYALIDQQRKELERDYNAGSRLYDSAQYERAKKIFEQCLELIRWFPYPLDTGRDYERLCAQNIRECDRRRREQKVKETHSKQEIAATMAEEEERRISEKRLLKIEILLKRITNALYLGEYIRAEKLCHELLEEDHENAMAKKLLRYSVDGRHAILATQIVKDLDEHYERTWEELAQVKVPYQDYVRFPFKDFWIDIACRREHGVAPEIEQEPIEIQHIKRILNTRTVTLSFTDTSLANVMSFLQDITGLNIVIDPRVDATVTLTLRLREIVLKNALQLIMDQTGFMYIFKENTIFITEEGTIPGQGIFEIYNVSDILARIPNFEGPDVRVFDPEAGGGVGGGPITFDDTEGESEGEPFGPEELIELIKQATGEENWPEEAGGFGTIEHHRGQLIVINTREMHKKVEAILGNLRRNTGIFVVMEVRFVDVRNDFLEDIGIDYRGLGNGGSIIGTPMALIANQSGGTDSGVHKRIPTPAGEDWKGRVQHVFDAFPGLLSGARIDPTPTSGLWLSSTWVDPFQINAILHAREETLAAHDMSSAMVTAHNRQRAFISVLRQRAYIADYDTSGAGGLTPIEVGDPIIRNFQEGIVLDVRPVVSSDRKYITIDVRPTYSALTTPTISTIVVNMGTFTQSVLNGIIEIPEVFLERAFTSVTIPDGGTAILGGLKEVVERKYVTSIPILDKLPIFNWVFKRKGYVRERRNLVILITGRIVILRDEEKAKFGTGPGG